MTHPALTTPRPSHRTGGGSSSSSSKGTKLDHATLTTKYAFIASNHQAHGIIEHLYHDLEAWKGEVPASLVEAVRPDSRNQAGDGGDLSVSVPEPEWTDASLQSTTSSMSSMQLSDISPAAAAAVGSHSTTASAASLPSSPFASPSVLDDGEIRKRVARHCVQLKRMLDKETNSSVAGEIPLIVHALLGKGKIKTPNFLILLRCLQCFPDPEIGAAILTMLLRIAGIPEVGTAYLAYYAKKNAVLTLVRATRAALLEYGQWLRSAGGVSPQDEVVMHKHEDFLFMLLHLNFKLARHDPKLAILTRLHRVLDTCSDILPAWVDAGNVALIQATLSLLKVTTAKNDNNVLLLAKGSLIATLERISRLIQNGQLLDVKLDTCFDVLLNLSRVELAVTGILKAFGVEYFITSFRSVGSEALQKQVLRILRNIAETEPGRRRFEHAGGVQIFGEVLEGLVQSLDALASTASGGAAAGNSAMGILGSSGSGGGSSSSSTTTPMVSLLLALLRASVSKANLPAIERYVHRKFPLPEAEPAATSGTDPSLQAPEEVVAEKFFAESCMANGVVPPIIMPPMPTIEVRHVQPMAMGPHYQCGHACPPTPEPQLKRTAAISKRAIFEQVSRMSRPPKEAGLPVVYDVMDDRVAEALDQDAGGGGGAPTLRFDSRFESGNLQMALKVSATEYDLLLQTDINSPIGRHNQWFHFSVQRMQSGTTYKFHLINMSKENGLFNYGMQPVMFSRREGVWRRVGEMVFYAKNHYRKNTLLPRKTEETGKPPVGPSEDTGALAGDVRPAATTTTSTRSSASPTYSTFTFTFTPAHPNDLCFFAYHYPYTYSDLQRCLFQLHRAPTYHTYCRRQVLCKTIGGNECALLTITDFDPESLLEQPYESRQYVVLSARVHPGESNSSHIMQGSIRFLLSEEEAAVTLRRHCIFKIVPMLNPDGVINGSHRCGLAGVDLNRKWIRPSRRRNPTIYWTKALCSHLARISRRPLLTCDFHGHSRKKNVFLFGCESRDVRDPPAMLGGTGSEDGVPLPGTPVSPTTPVAPGPPAIYGFERIFPLLLSNISPCVNYATCRFGLEPSKEGTARIVLFRELGIISSYTLESSFCGCDTGEKKQFQFSIGDLERVGVDFCLAVLAYLRHPAVLERIALSNEALPPPVSATGPPAPTPITRKKGSASSSPTKKTKIPSRKKTPKSSSSAASAAATVAARKPPSGLSGRKGASTTSRKSSSSSLAHSFLGAEGELEGEELLLPPDPRRKGREGEESADSDDSCGTQEEDDADDEDGERDG